MKSDRVSNIAPKSAHVTLGLLARPVTIVTLHDFAAQLSEQLQEQKLEIVNANEYLKHPEKLKKAQSEIQFQIQQMEKYSQLCETTNGLLHILPLEEDKGFRILENDQVIEYYNQEADLTIERKQCTCDGLCSTAFKLAKQLLTEQSITNVTVEICKLSHWGHKLIRLSQTHPVGDSLFYDPWYQLCFTRNPAEPKIFPEERLGVEMENLMELSPLIRHTQFLFDLENSKQVQNINRDFSYFVVCSNGNFNNPSEVRPDPTQRPLSLCLLS